MALFWAWAGRWGMVYGNGVCMVRVGDPSAGPGPGARERNV